MRARFSRFCAASWRNAGLTIGGMCVGVLGACKTPTPLTEIEGAPGIWRVSDADTTVYLFGTIHVLRPDLKWQTPALKKALAQSDAIYFEADTSATSAKAIEATIERLGYLKEGQTIYDILDDDQDAKLEAVADNLKIPMAFWDDMQPWLLAMSVYQLQNTEIGYFDAYGVENVIETLPEVKGKAYRYLTPLDVHLGYLGNLDRETQIEFLMSGLDELEEMETEIDNLVRAWLLGDIEELDAIVNQSETLLDETIYDVLIVERNADWVTQIDALLDREPGIFFIAVGAAHLTGKDSVQKGLEALGEIVVRVQ